MDVNFPKLMKEINSHTTTAQSTPSRTHTHTHTKNHTQAHHCQSAENQR